MTQDEIYIQRLAYIKYLWLQAVEQLTKPEPICSYALLTMQDAVEMFLLCGINKHSANFKQNDSFIGYWDKLDSKLNESGTSLSQKSVVMQANTARVALKHHLTFPNAQQLNEYYVHINTFFKENTPVVFGFDFESISLADLVTTEVVREHVKKAEELIEQNQLSKSVSECALGMYELFECFSDKLNYYDRKNNSNISLHSFVYNVKIDPEFQTIGSAASREMKCILSLAKQTRQFHEITTKAMANIDIFIIQSILGIDLGKQYRFNMIAPPVRIRYDGGYDILEPNILTEDSKSAQFCISFVVECALKEQNFQWWE